MSAPARPIQPQPVPLLSLLGIKNAGVAPDTLLGEVAPSIEMLPLYLLGKVQANDEGWSRNIAAGTPTGFAALQDTATGTRNLAVPASEVWWVDNVTISVGAGVGGTATGARIAYQNFNGKTFALPRSPELTLAAQQTRLQADGGFWLPPGSILGFYWDSVTVATATWALTGLQYVPVRV